MKKKIYRLSNNAKYLLACRGFEPGPMMNCERCACPLFQCVQVAPTGIQMFCVQCNLPSFYLDERRKTDQTAIHHLAASARWDKAWDKAEKKMGRQLGMEWGHA